MKIRNRLNPSNPCFSFEFFPPKTDEGVAELFAHARGPGARCEPGFVSVTYGAGGCTRDRTRRAGHAHQARDRHRGDGAPDLRRATPATSWRRSSTGCAEADGERAGPARRPAAGQQATFAPGARRLPLRLRAGRASSASAARLLPRRRRLPRGPPRVARRATTTCSTSRRRWTRGWTSSSPSSSSTTPSTSTSSSGRARAGITVPIVPGIMPITNFEQIERFTRMCGATIPDAAGARSWSGEGRPRGDPAARAWRTPPCSAWSCSRAACPGIHFYTLNKSPATRLIVSALVGGGSPLRLALRAPRADLPTGVAWTSGRTGHGRERDPAGGDQEVDPDPGQDRANRLRRGQAEDAAVHEREVLRAVEVEEEPRHGVGDAQHAHQHPLRPRLPGEDVEEDRDGREQHAVHEPHVQAGTFGEGHGEPGVAPHTRVVVHHRAADAGHGPARGEPEGDRVHVGADGVAAEVEVEEHAHAAAQDPAHGGHPVPNLSSTRGPCVRSSSGW